MCVMPRPIVAIIIPLLSERVPSVSVVTITVKNCHRHRSRLSILFLGNLDILLAKKGVDECDDL